MRIPTQTPPSTLETDGAFDHPVPNLDQGG